MPAPDSRSAPAPLIRTLAIGLSIVLHVAVLYAAGRMQWVALEAPEPLTVTRVVLVNELARISPTEMPAPPEPESPPELPAEPPERESPPELPAEPLAPPQAERPLRVDAPEGESPPQAAETNRRQRNYLAPGIDWDEERARAIAKVLEEQAREQNYMSFSTEDVFKEPQAETPNPRENLFDSPRANQRGSNRSVLRTGQSRSAFMNRLADLCNTLTGGGVGLSFAGMALGSACTEPGPTADFFADLRPDYMNMLPICTASETAQGQAPMFDADGNEIPTTKCRLAEKDALTGLAVIP